MAKVKKLVLVGYDTAQSILFAMLAEAIKETRGDIEVVTYLANASPSYISKKTLASLAGDISSAGFVLIGMSSDFVSSQIELCAARYAHRFGVPFGFYSDAPHSVLRASEGSWFNEHANFASLFVGLFPMKQGAAELVGAFPHARFVETGNPLRDALAQCSFSGMEVRTRFAIEDKKHVIVAPGGKFAAGNMATWMFLIEAIRFAGYGDEVALLLPLHPGDRLVHAVDGETDETLYFYEEIATDSPITTIIVHPVMHSISDVVQAADLVVEFSGTASVIAAMRQIPVISINFDVWARRYANEAGGMRNVEVVERGAGISVAPDLHDVSTLITELLDSSTPVSEELRIGQALAYPMPVPNESLGRIMHELFKMIDR